MQNSLKSSKATNSGQLMQMMGTDTTEYDSRLACRMETLALLIKSLSLPLEDIRHGMICN